eukprot:5588488-Amphidinium_carterae.1
MASKKQTIPHTHSAEISAWMLERIIVTHAKPLANKTEKGQRTSPQPILLPSAGGARVVAVLEGKAPLCSPQVLA